MKVNIYLILFINSILFFSSCKKDSESTMGPDVPKLQIDSITRINYSSARITTTVLSEGASAIVRMGVVIGKKENPTVVSDGVFAFSSQNSEVPLLGTGTFTTDLIPSFTNPSFLESGETYFVRSYATNSSGTFYSEQRSFTTLKLAKVETKAISEITLYSAKLSGTISEAKAEAEITGRGFYYENDSTFSFENSPVYCGQGSGDFSANLVNLTPGVAYFVWAFASGANGITYGKPVKFTTTALPLPVVTTSVVTNIARMSDSYIGFSASAGGNVTSDGGDLVTDRGIYLSESPISTTSPSPFDQIEVGTGIGSFTKQIDELKPGKTYYVRAYAINKNGITFGNQQSFTTPDISLKFYNSVTLGAQESTFNSYFASSNGEVYSNMQAGNNSSIVDITYGYSSFSFQPLILSWPSRENLLPNEGVAPQNAPNTKFTFINVSSSEFEKINSAKNPIFLRLNNSFSSPQFNDPYISISQDQVYAFLSGSRKGLIRIREITNGPQGNVKFDVKVIE